MPWALDNQGSMGLSSKVGFQMAQSMVRFAELSITLTCIGY